MTKDSITTSIDFAGETLISSHEDGYVRSWDVRHLLNPANSFQNHTKYVNTTQFNPNFSNIFASVTIY